MFSSHFEGGSQSDRTPEVDPLARGMKDEKRRLLSFVVVCVPPVKNNSQIASFVKGGITASRLTGLTNVPQPGK